MTSATKVAVVTGGSRGIGRAAAERLAREGYSVVVGFAGNVEAADDAVAAITAAGGTAVAVKGDVGDASDVAALFDAAQDAFGGVDVVVHAAGIMRITPLAEYDVDDLDAVLRANVRGTLLVAQQAARTVRPGGSVVLFSSSVIGRALPGYAVYAASKGAVEAVPFILAHELRGRDVTVNAIAPGPTATDLFLDGKTPEQLAFFAAASPLDRLGTPEDIAEVVTFLAGPAGHWVNGQVLRANGGLH
ncbi:MAG: SDR family oxidoreductase [Promicromonosporaceae bacterium]|nr:SDR family oxidoreductase [Promicromonosporaceae bacterium]